MKIQEYIRSVIKPIRSKTQSRQIAAELKDHIIVNQEFFEEIGYDTDTAQEKAVECMGDAESVGDRFSKIHNASIIEIVFAIFKRLIFFALLSVFCFFINRFELNIGEVYEQTLFCQFLCFLFIFYISSFIALRKKDIWYNFITVILFFAFPDCICSIQLHFLLFLPIIINCIFTVIYNIKSKKMKNSKRDLKCKKALEIITGILIVILFVLFVTFAVRINSQIQNVIEQREITYTNACEISKKIAYEYNNTDKTMDEIIEEYEIYIEDSELYYGVPYIFYKTIAPLRYKEYALTNPLNK